MERLTRIFEENNQKYICIDVCKEKCVENNTWCPKCEPFTNVLNKLVRYEDLEEKLTKVYGECDGLLETAINSLLKHEGAEIGTPAKARLLTDEDVDKWESFKDAEEQGKLIILPCKVGDTAYHVHKEYLKNADKWIKTIDEVEVESFAIYEKLILANARLCAGNDRFGKTLRPYRTLFFTKEEAEQALAKMKEV